MSQLSLKIKNRTGGSQHYVFVSAAPVVSGGMTGKVWSHVVKTANSTPNGGQASVELRTEYYAVTGSYEGSVQFGSQASFSKTVRISLGSRESRGSTVSLSFSDSVGDLGPPSTPGQGKIEHFNLSTNGINKSVRDLQNSNLLVGVAASVGGEPAILGSFAAYPNSNYQILPPKILYVAVERFNRGSFVSPEMMGNVFAVDFTARGTNNVTLVHNEMNGLEFI